ncbi:hypothetical protein [Bradyrhizobium lablabi]|uniref:hypothetical protein n=1 Tax=Bradyrhizobium lablabi TaxID=722472 RepID=UPI001BA79034|nr:hypothetical protein [Bradyrhizobium lablabi]MBR0694323.1 hypothetical protein [Bradyrhizobium lablabi]
MIGVERAITGVERGFAFILKLQENANSDRANAKIAWQACCFDVIAARSVKFTLTCAAHGHKVVDGVTRMKHLLPLHNAFGEARHER